MRSTTGWKMIFLGMALPLWVACSANGTAGGGLCTGNLCGTDTSAELLTETWLGLQVSGSQASEQSQYATAEERERANQRLLDSYNHPIPEYMPRAPGGSTSE